jgi:hypothetical protein
MDGKLQSMYATISPNSKRNPSLKLLLKIYQNLFKEPKGLQSPML